MPRLLNAGRLHHRGHHQYPTIISNATGSLPQGAAVYERRNSLSFNMERYQGTGVLGVGYAAHRGVGSGSNLVGMAGGAGQGHGQGKAGDGDAKSFLVL